LTIWHCILSAELTKIHFFRLFFGGFCPLGRFQVETLHWKFERFAN